MSLKTTLKPALLVVLVFGALYFAFLYIYGGQGSYFKQTKDEGTALPGTKPTDFGGQHPALNFNPEGVITNQGQLLQQLQQQLSQIQQQVIHQQQQSDQREQKLQQQIQQIQQQVQTQPNVPQNGVNNLPGQPSSSTPLPPATPGPGQNNQQVQVPLPINLHPDVNIVPSIPDQGLVLPYKDCVPFPMSPKPGVFICIHPVQDDMWVSGEFKKNKVWEYNLVSHMQKVLETDTRLSVLDLGCNIGVYTLWAAAMGREVVSVEMLMTNVNLVQTSLQMSGLSKSVTIVNNAVFSDHRTLGTQFMSRNIGGTRLNTSNVFETVDTKKGGVTVKTICLDDLLPLLAGKILFIKMDIENSEHQALACAHKLFNEVDIKAVQMEWLNKTPQEGDQILEFMKLHNYAASKSALNYEPLQIMQGDLYFLKKSTFSIP